MKIEKISDFKRDEILKRESELKIKLENFRGFDEKSRG